MSALRQAAPAPKATPAGKPATRRALVPDAAEFREHDLMIRRFHLAGLTPAEIAVVLSSKGLRVKTWHVSETFVRCRLTVLDFKANPSRDVYSQGTNRYCKRPQFRDPQPA